ncbi:MAG: radical SAM protein [Thermoguttaceae bacterium]|jgi:radical SAM superfamily enzyme YgiQ (UPF0313 family)|nr:radical SAM protein [Thermoguttaceae bacterium]
MLTLINTNRMKPPIAPIGLDYLATAARAAGIETDVVDLCLAGDPGQTLTDYFARHTPELVGISFRNVDDCFWPGAGWFVPELESVVAGVRDRCDAPIVLGGVGFSIFAEDLVQKVGADFGVRGDGEQALVALVRAIRSRACWDEVPGLVRRRRGAIRSNPPAWPNEISLPTARDAIDNRTYFERGGQIGVETRRGCNRPCAYCADPLAKGSRLRLRDPREVAAEVASLADRGIDVLHLCDSEFNLPRAHAIEVCDELIRRRLGDRVRWYAYLAVVPFDTDLARRMRRAGCAGINFTADSANAAMLSAYRHPHRREDLSEAVRACRSEGIAVMLDLLFGGPGETAETVAETIEFVRAIGPDCAGAALGIRLYPGTPLAGRIAAQCPLDRHPGVHRGYEGPVDLLRPTFYVSPALGERPAALVRELIAGDPRFFAPVDATSATAVSSQYNYSENRVLIEAIAAGARGAYWDILRRFRQAQALNGRGAG